MRLYFWFKGAPRDRPGGPWWYRQFPNEWMLHRFLEDTKAFLYAWARTFEGSESLPDPMHIRPPGNASIEYADGRHKVPPSTVSGIVDALADDDDYDPRG